MHESLPRKNAHEQSKKNKYGHKEEHHGLKQSPRTSIIKGISISEGDKNAIHTFLTPRDLFPIFE